MKVINEGDYTYLGILDSWYVFESNRINFDPEIIMLKRARMNLKDGTSRFFDPIPSLGKESALQLLVRKA